MPDNESNSTTLPRPVSRRVVALLLVFLCTITLAAAAGLARSPQRRDLVSPRSLEYKLNLNTADADDLCLLRGIGPKLAGYIIEERQRVGRFESIEQLDQVKRIGPATLRSISPHVSVQSEGR